MTTPLNSIYMPEMQSYTLKPDYSSNSGVGWAQFDQSSARTAQTLAVPVGNSTFQISATARGQFDVSLRTVFNGSTVIWTPTKTLVPGQTVVYKINNSDRRSYLSLDIRSAPPADAQIGMEIITFPPTE